LELVDGKGEKSKITGRRFVIGVGGRPSMLNIPGADLCITSDDIFSLKESPGKTLIIGAGYIALECAGFLTAIGLETTIMVRSTPLREFDQESVSKIVEVMKNGTTDEAKHKTRFLQPCVPLKIEKVKEGLKVEYQNTEDKTTHTVID
jgi:thioredoxin reductase (NADPH)